MQVRVMFEQPEARPPFVGNEVEPDVRINLKTGLLTGFVGRFERLPDDPREEAVRVTSTPFEVSLSPERLGAILNIVKSAAAEQGVAGATLTSIWTVDGQPV